MPSAEFDAHKRTFHTKRRLSKATKKLIAERDHYRCKVCGTTKDLEVHHIDDDPLNDDVSNLELRCRIHNPRGHTFWYAD